MNKIRFAHFTRLSKRPISSPKSFKYPTSIPSPKNSSRKFSNNIQSPNKEDELIKRKFLYKSKNLKQTSSLIFDLYFFILLINTIGFNSDIFK